MATFWSGNGGSVTFGSTTLTVIKWSRRPANRKADTTASDTFMIWVCGLCFQKPSFRVMNF